MVVNPDSGVERALKQFRELNRFTGAPAEFWPAFVMAASGLIGASRGILLLRNPDQPSALRKLSEWTRQSAMDRTHNEFARMFGEIAQGCVQQGSYARLVEKNGAPDAGHFAVAVLIPLSGTNDQCVAAFLLPETTESRAREAVERLQLAAETPTAYRLNQAVSQARKDVEKFANVLDVMLLVNAEKRFTAASMAFCNGLATRYQCDRVTLGWVEAGYVRLRTISRTERFDRNMTAVKALETMMEEALDQDEEVVWPVPPDNNLIAKDHEAFAKGQNSNHICSVPLRLDGKPIAVLSCERQAKPFSEGEVQELRLACEQAVRRLSDLKRQDRWFGARWATQTREQLSKLVGPEHTWAKVLSLLGAAVLVLLLIPIFTYRVEGEFILRSDDVSYMTAPFEGYIRKSFVRPGDIVTNGAPLLNFDTTDLELEEAAAIAEEHRYLREAEKARADAQQARLPNFEALAEMKIAQALAEQAQARLDTIRYRLSQSTIKAPFDAILVEGDLRQKAGAPVKQGDILFKVARTDKLYVEAEINERDVHEIKGNGSGEISFVTQPKLTFPVKITQIEPAAFPKDGKNLFIVRCAFDMPVEGWWRPGMSGVCKLNVERRTLLWILTHRTVDFLRLWLWW